MPYKDITYDNGFTERVYYNVTASEEAERFKRSNRVKSFPSANHRAAVKRTSISNSHKQKLPDE
ncbi:hypothetical protein OAC48_05835 [Porticoccaceae bacterium]|nr:hypothetical protein [Porticoccaceae bacterium]